MCALSTEKYGIWNVSCAYPKHFTVSALEMINRDTKFVVSKPTDNISVIHLIVTVVLLLV
jgi:hypothetical protein